MNIKYLPQDEQPRELLSYLGVGKSSVGRRCILACFDEIASGCVPGMEVYEHVAMFHGRTAAQVVKNGQRALVKAQRKRPREWEEIFPGLDLGRAGLTLFLCGAAAWLHRNRIGYFYLGSNKYRIPESKNAHAPDNIGETLDKS